MVFTVQSRESESKVINERFSGIPRRSCLDTAWPPTVFNYTYGAERLNPETAEHYEYMTKLLLKGRFSGWPASRQYGGHLTKAVSVSADQNQALGPCPTVG